MIKEHIFRKYDIRGTFNEDFKIEDIYYIAKSIAFFLKQRKSSIKSIVIAMDGRLHSPLIKNELCKGIRESGLNVIFIGLCPTPLLYFATHELEVDAGIIITASHNPPKDNGFKIILDKESIWNEDIFEIRELYKNRSYIEANQTGTYKEISIIDKYVQYIKSKFPNLCGLSLNIVIDCSNGAAGSVLPILVEQMEWQNVHLINEVVDGNFPNHEPDPTIESNMLQLKNYLKENSKLRYGIGLDGDCDRLAAMTNDGYLIPGDKLLGIFCHNLIKNATENTVVFDIKCSNGLIEVLNKLNLKASISPTGHANIKKNMKETNAIFGGELSGHYCFNDRYFGYDDGIYAILRLLEITSNNTLNKLLENFPETYSSREFRLVCTEKQKEEILQFIANHFVSSQDYEIIKIDGIRANSKYGWGLIRASNTEALLSLRFEGKNLESLSKLKEDFYKPLCKFFEKGRLRKELDLG